ncbi:uncharacterized protein LOC144363573 [Saccoglossus kowalevskii]
MLRYRIRNPDATTVRPGLPDPVSTDNPDETYQANEEVFKVLTTLGSHGRKRKRWQYEVYNPELSAKICKFASENGNSRAVRRLTVFLGKSINESTIPSMKEGYIKEVQKSKTQPVTSIHHAKRGRPLLLDELDS